MKSTAGQRVVGVMGFLIAIGGLLLGTAGPAAAQEAGQPASPPGPSISGAAQECIPRVEFPVLDARIVPPDSQARLYFRAATAASFYSVEMVATGEGFQAVLPVPAPETEQVVYYVEAVGPDGTLARTDEYVARVVDDLEQCDEELLVYPAEPGIVLGSVPGAPPVPPGFEPAGIVGAVVGRGAPGWLWPVTIAGGIGAGIFIFEEIDDEEPVSPVIP